MLRRLAGKLDWPWIPAVWRVTAVDERVIETERGVATSAAVRPDESLPAVVRQFWVASLAAFVLLWVVRALERRAGFPESYSHFLGKPFTDLLEYVGTFKLLHTAAFFEGRPMPAVAYPPFGALLYGLLYGLGKSVVVYLVLAAGWLAGLVWGVRRALLLLGVAGWEAALVPVSMVAVSFPMIGLLQSGNLELFVWVFSALGVWLLVRGKDDAAAVLWALAAATKLYPIVFLVLLLPKRKYRAFGLGLVTFAAVSVASMKFIGPSVAVAWHGSLRNVFGYQGVRVGEWSLHELAANHSAFGLVKLVASVLGHSSAGLTLPYYALGGIVFAAVFFGRLAKMPLVNQVLGVSAFMVMLPPVSYFYTLVHLYAPWLMLLLLAVESSRSDVQVPGLRRTMFLCLPLFASFTLMTFPKVLLFGGLVQAVVLVMLFVCAAMFPFKQSVTKVASKEQAGSS